MTPLEMFGTLLLVILAAGTFFSALILIEQGIADYLDQRERRREPLKRERLP